MINRSKLDRIIDGASKSGRVGTVERKSNLRVANPDQSQAVATLATGFDITSKATGQPPLAKRLDELMRPILRGQIAYEPLRIKASLNRLGVAIAALDRSEDQLLHTADLILAEEQLKVEILRDRLQGMLEG